MEGERRALREVVVEGARKREDGAIEEGGGRRNVIVSVECVGGDRGEV